jgi:hypothetical protein
LSKAWRTRPSEIYEIEEPLAALNFDRAVNYFGSRVEAEMEEAAEKAKTQKIARSKSLSVLNRYLEPAGQQFRDPAALAKKSPDG